MAKQKKAQQSKIFTIPNLLSLFRLLLIPPAVWLYLKKQAYGWTTTVLTLSALPVITLYLAMSKQFISGLTAGAVKG